ncbi:hypothetical protein [Microbispora bryophytorum]|uniref:hypothetical protein n=1 Tax=Microbispora bryophytorum TaxID=1460882 RepID=UPI00340215ED
MAADLPGANTFLVDTYDTLTGVRAAIAVSRRMRLPRPLVVRLDSGDLADLSRQARRMLDEAGLPDAEILAGGGLDEYAIDDLVWQGAPIDIYAVGTKVGVSADAPSLNSAYKLVDYDGRPVMKLSAGKVTLPGVKAPSGARARAARPAGAPGPPQRTPYPALPACPRRDTRENDSDPERSNLPVTHRLGSAGDDGRCVTSDGSPGRSSDARLHMVLRRDVPRP